MAIASYYLSHRRLVKTALASWQVFCIKSQLTTKRQIHTEQIAKDRT